MPPEGGALERHLRGGVSWRGSGRSHEGGVRLGLQQRISTSWAKSSNSCRNSETPPGAPNFRKRSSSSPTRPKLIDFVPSSARIFRHRPASIVRHGRSFAEFASFRPGLRTSHAETAEIAPNRSKLLFHRQTLQPSGRCTHGKTRSEVVDVAPALSNAACNDLEAACKKASTIPLLPLALPPHRSPPRSRRLTRTRVHLGRDGADFVPEAAGKSPMSLGWRCQIQRRRKG